MLFFRREGFIGQIDNIDSTIGNGCNSGENSASCKSRMLQVQCSDKNNYMNDKDPIETENSARLPMRAIELVWCDEPFFQRT